MGLYRIRANFFRLGAMRLLRTFSLASILEVGGLQWH